jgi:membrane-bound lytic murein transglycosylase D
MKAFIAIVSVLAVVGCAVRSDTSREPRPGVETVSQGVGHETDSVAPQRQPATTEEVDQYWEDLLASTFGEPRDSLSGDSERDENVTPAAHDLLSEVDPEIDAATLELERAIVAKSEPEFDYPIVTNDKVLGWIDYYANRYPQGFAKGLARSGKYLPMFRRIFAEAGVPQDLVFLAHVESAYKPTAYSRARAKGIFQFISATGKRYGLRIDYWVDERSDPEKSARASAAYLKDLYDEFGDWYLALAGYNAGEGRVRRAVRNTGSHDFWTISKGTRHLRRETRNYVPAIIAATMISKDPAKYGIDVDYAPFQEYETVQVDGAADLRVLAKCAGTDFETLRGLNPALRRYQTPPAAKTDVRVPVGSAEQTLLALAEVPKNERVLYARHKVRTGETLSKLARDYGVTVRAIQETNTMGRSTVIRVGRTLIIPTASGGDYPAIAQASSGETVQYRVRRGDNLSSLARRHGTSSAAIASASGISTRSTLRVGQRLTIVPGVRSKTAAARIARGDETPPASSKTYTVRRGDSLWRIASRHNTTVSRLCSLNKISPKTVLRPGTRLSVR